MVVNVKRFLLKPEFHYSQVHAHEMEAAKKKKKISCKPVTTFFKKRSWCTCFS